MKFTDSVSKMYQYNMSDHTCTLHLFSTANLVSKLSTVHNILEPVRRPSL
jgi:hypothetical protein